MFSLYIKTLDLNLTADTNCKELKLSFKPYSSEFDTLENQDRTIFPTTQPLNCPSPVLDLIFLGSPMISHLNQRLFTTIYFLDFVRANSGNLMFILFPFGYFCSSFTSSLLFPCCRFLDILASVIYLNISSRRWLSSMR